MEEQTAVTFNILIKHSAEEGFIAHCLELDIVTTAATEEAVKSDIFDLIVAQIRYAFANDNLEHLYLSAPSEVWKEFYECHDRIQERREIPNTREAEELEKFVPPWIVANTCRSIGRCHV